MRPVSGSGVDGCYAIRLCREVDVSRTDELDALVLLFARSTAVDAVVDLSDVTFMDSTGLRFIVRIYWHCRARGGRVEILRPQPRVRRAIEATGLHLVCDLTGMSPEPLPSVHPAAPGQLPGTAATVLASEADRSPALAQSGGNPGRASARGPEGAGEGVSDDRKCQPA